MIYTISFVILKVYANRKHFAFSKPYMHVENGVVPTFVRVLCHVYKSIHNEIIYKSYSQILLIAKSKLFSRFKNFYIWL